MLPSHTDALQIAVADFKGALQRSRLIALLGWQDVKQRYRRSALGPFWITISMGVSIGAIGVVFGKIFQSKMDDYLPFLTIGMILWAFISSTIMDACGGFVASEGIIKQLPLPLSLHIFRIVWRNILILAHNLIILPIVFIIYNKPVGLSVISSILGLTLLILIVTLLSLSLSAICTRYRDLPQVVNSFMQIAYFITPILWMPAQMPAGPQQLILFWNPFYHMIEIIRAPLIGGHVGALHHWVWLVCFLVPLGLVSSIFFGRYKNRVPYWL